jgi:hypothetical protein
MCPRLAAEHGLGTYPKVRAEAHKLDWADTLILVRESPPGWCMPAASRSAHGQGPRAANSVDKRLESESGALQWPNNSSDLAHRNTSRPSDTVSRELAGGLSRSLIGESHDQRRVEWAVQ